MLHIKSRLVLFLTLISTAGMAHETAPDGHGPSSSGGFSHQFRLRAHTPDSPQIAFHFGLLQPIALGGFNAAADFRLGRFIATYSHGQGLDVSDLGSPEERDLGVPIEMPWSTGFGVGSVLIDELYVLADFKVHSVEVGAGDQAFGYRTVTVGAEIGYRLFLYKGLHIAPVVRYWPRVWSSLDGAGRPIGDTGVIHEPVAMGPGGGLFANVLVGWAFQP